MRLPMNDQAENILDTMLDQQKQAWIAGKRPSVDEFLQNTHLQNDTEVFLDLLYNEIVVREELGESPSLEEYIQRYPHLEEDLQLHFEVHSAIQDRFLVDTYRADNAESLADIDVPEIELGPDLKDYELITQLGQGGMGA